MIIDDVKIIHHSSTDPFGIQLDILHKIRDIIRNNKEDQQREKIKNLLSENENFNFKEKINKFVVYYSDQEWIHITFKSEKKPKKLF